MAQCFIHLVRALEIVDIAYVDFEEGEIIRKNIAWKCVKQKLPDYTHGVHMNTMSRAYGANDGEVILNALLELRNQTRADVLNRLKG